MHQISGKLPVAVVVTQFKKGRLDVGSELIQPMNPPRYGDHIAAAPGQARVGREQLWTRGKSSNVKTWEWAAANASAAAAGRGFERNARRTPIQIVLLLTMPI